MKRLTILAAFCLVSCTRPSPPQELEVGQWVWSRGDAALFADGRSMNPMLHSAVWIGTLVRDGSSVRSQLGVSPSIVKDSTATLVIRLDDSLHPLVDSLGTEALARSLGARIDALFAAIGPSRAGAAIQLDYDAPVRLLPQWAALVRELRRSTLRGHPVWITSLLVHVEQPSYGRWFRGVVDGHVLQLFDTQVEYSDAMQRKVERVVASAGLPCAIGVGAYERQLAGGATTEHRAWLPWAVRAVREGRVDAMWVFAARRSYRDLLSPVGP